MCIHLNLMIFTKIIRGFIRAEPEPVTENSKEDYVNIGFVFLIFLTLGLAIPFKALHHRLKEKTK